jgi:aspartyl-tRNA(Asn)/glutamyl-tRNA(Gln) amidotransferase subunit A
MDAAVRDAFDQLVETLRDAGHSLEPVSLPVLNEAMELGPRTIGIAESGSIIETRFADVLGEHPELADAVTQSKQVSGPTLARAYHRVAEFRSYLRRAFGRYDLLLTPTLPCRVPDGSNAYLEQEIEVGGVSETRTEALTRFVNPWNLAAVPCGTQPVDTDHEGGPISMQFIGPSFSEWKLLDIMQYVEGLVGGPWDTVPLPQ